MNMEYIVFTIFKNKRNNYIEKGEKGITKQIKDYNFKRNKRKSLNYTTSFVPFLLFPGYLQAHVHTQPK
jgi:hypothetical protein